MAHNVVVQVASLRQHVRTVGAVFSLPQWKHFVSALLALLSYDETRTLTGILRQAAVKRRLSGVSRFLIHGPWSIKPLISNRQRRFNTLVAPEVVQPMLNNEPDSHESEGVVTEPS